METLRARARQVHGRKLVKAIYVSILPKSKLGRAILYLFGLPTAVSLGDPRIQIHDNDSERDLRHIAVGQSNGLVFASPRGGGIASRLYSLALWCKRASVSLAVYLEDVLEPHVWTHPPSPGNFALPARAGESRHQRL